MLRKLRKLGKRVAEYAIIGFVVDLPVSGHVFAIVREMCVPHDSSGKIRRGATIQVPS
jgi:hypothetical protein